MRARHVILVATLAAVTSAALARIASAQISLRPDGMPTPPAVKSGGSANMQVVAHVPLEGYFSSAGVDVEQELSRPYAYVGRIMEWTGFSIISLADPSRARIIYDWRLGQPAKHIGYGGENGRYFKLGSRYYYIPHS